MNNKKLPCIPPLIHENKFITDFKQKTDIFNHFFVNQYTLVKNSSKLAPDCERKTPDSLSTTEFTNVDIEQITRKT